jgi:hypothetical protein
MSLLDKRYQRQAPPQMSQEELQYYMQEEARLRELSEKQKRKEIRNEVVSERGDIVTDDTAISYKDVPIQRAISIKKDPTPKGYFETVIGGVPVDLHSLEEYIVSVSPFSIQTIMKYNEAEMIEDIKNYSKGTGRKPFDMKTIFLILLVVGMGILGVIVMLYMPNIMAMFQSGI